MRHDARVRGNGRSPLAEMRANLIYVAA